MGEALRPDVDYIIDRGDPFADLEPTEAEVSRVDAALQSLVRARMLPHACYDVELMLSHRKAVRQRFCVPWTTVTPRMERLLYAVGAIRRPLYVVCVGVFCGFTLAANIGAAVGPGRCYTARRLVGIEVRAAEAELARRNLATIATPGDVEIVTADGRDWLKACQHPIDLLYLDTDGSAGGDKSVYLDMLSAASNSLGSGSLVLAHDSVLANNELATYLACVRNTTSFTGSANVVLDAYGLEMTMI